MASFQMQGTAKLHQVTQLLSSLEKDLQEKKLTTTESEQTLLQLRQHGTDPRNAGPIYSQNGMNILAQYGVEGETAGIRRAALRCTANALLLDAKMRQVFVDTGYGGKLADTLKEVDDSEDELGICRVLFYTTYGTTMDFEDLIKNHSLVENVTYQLSRHAKQFPKSGRTPLSQMDELAFTDSVKLVHNIAKIWPGLAAHFSPCIPHMLKVISRIDISDKPLDGLLGYLINAVSTLDLQEKDGKVFENSPLFPTFNPNCNVERLISVLDKAVAVYSSEELERKAVPLIYALMLIFQVAPEEPRKYMQSALLPDDNDRDLPIGQSDTLSSKILKLSTSHFAHLKVVTSELIFALCDKDAEIFIKKIGFGFAAGFLADRGIAMPQSASEAHPAASEAELINPVTGQRLNAEPIDNLPPMTQEEKEREAEKTFVMFERMKALGLIKETPMEQAVQEGRFEELPDDADSD